MAHKSNSHNNNSSSRVQRDPRANAVKETTESRAASPGRRRVSLREQRRTVKLFGLEPEKGYFYRVFNDDPVRNRIPKLLERGYEFVRATSARGRHEGAALNIGDPTLDVPETMSSFVRRPVDRNKDGSIMWGYLMRIREEWKKEDDDFKEERYMHKERIQENWQESNPDFYTGKDARAPVTGGINDPRNN